MNNGKHQQTHDGHSEEFPKYDQLRDQAKCEKA
jgi:hypothetical protein